MRGAEKEVEAGPGEAAAIDQDLDTAMVDSGRRALVRTDDLDVEMGRALGHGGADLTEADDLQPATRETSDQLEGSVRSGARVQSDGHVDRARDHRDRLCRPD